MSEEPEIRGTCQDMCPEQERAARQRERRLHRFEMVEGTEQDRHPLADPSRCVKEYSRPAAGKDIIPPAELRPPQVLLSTVDYLVNRILPREDAHFSEVYNFLSDRLRAVRQDMVVQRVKGHVCVAILEKAVRFHVYAAYRLCESSVQQFDPHLNSQQLENCLTWLLKEYQDDGQVVATGNRASMEALYLLYCLGSHDALQHGLTLPKSTRQSQVVQLALQVHLAQLRGDFVQLFRLARQLPFIHSCAVHRHLASVRSWALQVMSTAYSSKVCRFPLSHLQCLLGFDDEAETAEFCRQHGLNATDSYVSFRRADFSFPEKVQPKLSQCLVDDKLHECTLPDIVNGKAEKLCSNDTDFSSQPVTRAKQMDSEPNRQINVTKGSEDVRVEPVTGAMGTLSLVGCSAEPTPAICNNMNTYQGTRQSTQEQTVTHSTSLVTTEGPGLESRSGRLSASCEGETRSYDIPSGGATDVQSGPERPWSGPGWPRGRGRGRAVGRGGQWRGRGRGRGRGKEYGM